MRYISKSCGTGESGYDGGDSKADNQRLIRMPSHNSYLEDVVCSVDDCRGRNRHFYGKKSANTGMRSVPSPKPE